MTALVMLLILWIVPGTLQAQSVIVPQSSLRLVSVDSQELVGQPGAGTNAIDGSPATLWHTQWKGAAPPLPHTIGLDLGTPMLVDGIRYLPRQDGTVNGTIAQYRIDVSTNGETWQEAAQGTWAPDTTEKTVRFPPLPCRYVRLTALAEVRGGPWTSAAEVGVWASPVPGGPSVLLAWDAPTPGSGESPPDGYVLERHDTQNQVFGDIGRTSTLTYTDHLPGAGTYTYRVRGALGTALSAPSNEVSVTLSGTPGTPQHLTVTVTGTGP